MLANLMATNLLTLLDDIATVLDDVSVMTRIAAGKTVGLLGDDLALNAEQVSGVRADRELPVVWAVFKGSARNKLILVPVALLLAAFAPFLIQPLLMLGGCYLCYEGFDKLAGKFLHPGEREAAKKEVIAVLRDPNGDLLEFERRKIRGAIRTDFVLSAEIIVIAMGTVREAAYATQVMTIIVIAVLMTLGVYGLVAAIVKIDDAGLHLVQTAGDSQYRRWTGERVLDFAPYLMKGLTIIGTAAMFLVGGGILAHGIPPLHQAIELLTHSLEEIATLGPLLAGLASLIMNGLAGIVAGAILVPVIGLFKKLTPNRK